MALLHVAFCRIKAFDTGAAVHSEGSGRHGDPNEYFRCSGNDRSGGEYGGIRRGICPGYPHADMGDWHGAFCRVSCGQLSYLQGESEALVGECV